MSVQIGAGLVCEPHAALPRDAFEHVSSSDVLSVVETMEALKAWADSISLAATGELTRRERAAALIEAGPDASATTRRRAVDAADSAMADELVLATGMGAREAASRVDVATAEPVRVHALTERLRAGEVSFWRVKTLYEECRVLPGPLAADVAEGVLAPVRGGAALSNPLFRQRLARRLARLVDSREQRARRLADRRVDVLIDPDGTGELRVTGGAARLRGAYSRVDDLARRLRKAGESRTLAQLRSDVTLDLLMFGHLGAAVGSGGGSGQAVASTGGAGQAVDGQPANGAEAEGERRESCAGEGGVTHGVAALNHADTAAPADPANPANPANPVDPAESSTAAGAADVVAPSFDPALVGRRWPIAQVSVVVGLGTLLGLDPEPGRISGAGGVDTLPAEVVREAAMVAGSTWRRLVIDPLDGSAVELSTTAYRPGAPLARAVRARDGECRVPGCVVPPEACDLDHDIERRRGGQTSEENLSGKHRPHHNHKTRGRWRALRDGELIRWTTGTGREYISYPYDYRPLPLEGAVSRVEHTLRCELQFVEFPLGPPPDSDGPGLWIRGGGADPPDLPDLDPPDLPDPGSPGLPGPDPADPGPPGQPDPDPPPF